MNMKDIFFNIMAVIFCTLVWHIIGKYWWCRSYNKKETKVYLIIGDLICIIFFTLDFIIFPVFCG